MTKLYLPKSLAEAHVLCTCSYNNAKKCKGFLKSDTGKRCRYLTVETNECANVIECVQALVRKLKSYNIKIDLSSCNSSCSISPGR
jgi:hypothetical protein